MSQAPQHSATEKALFPLPSEQHPRGPFRLSCLMQCTVQKKVNISSTKPWGTVQIAQPWVYCRQPLYQVHEGRGVTTGDLDACRPPGLVSSGRFLPHTVLIKYSKVQNYIWYGADQYQITHSTEVFRV